jgi:hypothetical protein
VGEDIDALAGFAYHTTVYRCRIIQRKSCRSGAIGKPVSVVRDIL